MSKNSENYHALMVRMWRNQDGEAWRASVHDPHTNETHHFPTMFHLYLFLNSKAINDNQAIEFPNLPIE